MTKCESIKPYISDYIENRLNPEHKSQLEQHFKECDSCKSLAKNMNAMRTVMSNLHTHKCSDIFYVNLRRKINKENHQSKFSTLNVRTIAYGFSFALLLMVSIISYNNFMSTDSQNVSDLPVIESDPAYQGPKPPVNQNVAGYKDADEIDIKTVSTEGKNDSSKIKDQTEQEARIKYVDVDQQ